MSDIVPVGWRVVPLSEVTHTRSGNGQLIKGKLLKQPKATSFPAFSASGQDVWTVSAEHRGSAVIVSAVGARCGKCFRADGRWSAIANTHVIWPKENCIDRDYLWWLINDENFWIKGGSAQPFVKVADTFRRPCTLPPLAEQRRIVARIEALFARIRRARADLERIAPLAKQFRRRTITSIVNFHTFPECEVRHVADVVTGTTPPTAERRHYGGNLPFIKPTDLDVGYSVIEGREHLTASGAAVSRPVPAGATLLTCIGATIGKAGFARVACATNQQINALVPKRHITDPSWLYFAIVSEDFQEAIAANSSATTLPIINKSRLEGLHVRLPKLAQQRHDVGRLERLLPLGERVQCEATRALALLDRLEQGILARAFRGELVAQDPAEAAEAVAPA